jgi:hypothetical protein
MAITTNHVTITTDRVQIDGSSPNPSSIWIYNAGNDKTIFIGTDNVTTANGFGLLKLEQLQITLNPGESLYAITESGTATMHWLRQTLY